MVNYEWEEIYIWQTKRVDKLRECSSCGKELEDFDEDMCEDCLASIVLNENIWPNEEDF